MMIDRQMRAAEAYTARGWKVFALTAGKVPLRNCAACQPGAGCPGQDGCVCSSVSCHGYYAATANLDHVRAMLWRVGDGGTLAVRTGAASGVIAVDGEGTDNDGYGSTGVEIMDEFETWTEGVSLPATLTANTSGGGLHMLYALPAGARVDSRNRVLPNLDIKSENGYIAVPPVAGRSWVDWQATMEEPGDALLAWMGGKAASGFSSSSTGTGQGAGLLSSLRTADVIPSGSRYAFLRDLVYHLRRSGRDYDEALGVCREYYTRFAQPPAARYELPWRQVEYELGRVWARVEPETALTFARQAWTDRARARKA